MQVLYIIYYYYYSDYGPLQTIAAYFRLHWVIINKLQGKAVTHGEKLEWWIILMVDCVTILLHFSTIRFPSANRRANSQK